MHDLNTAPILANWDQTCSCIAQCAHTHNQLGHRIANVQIQQHVNRLWLLCFAYTHDTRASLPSGSITQCGHTTKSLCPTMIPENILNWTAYTVSNPSLYWKKKKKMVIQLNWRILIMRRVSQWTYLLNCMLWSERTDRNELHFIQPISKKTKHNSIYCAIFNLQIVRKLFAGTDEYVNCGTNISWTIQTYVEIYWYIQYTFSLVRFAWRKNALRMHLPPEKGWRSSLYIASAANIHFPMAYSCAVQL